MTSRRTSVIVAACIATLVAIGVIAAIMLHSRGGDQGNGEFTGSPTPPADVAAFDTDRADVFSKSLASGDPQQLAGVVAVPDGTAVTPEAAAGFAGLGALEFDLDTLAYHEDGVATVTARAEHGTEPVWTVYLTWVDNTWKISATGPASGR